MRTFPMRAVVIATVMAALTPSFTANAQAQGQTTEQASAAQAGETRTFDLSFPGGDLNEYAAALRKAHGQANIAIVGVPESILVSRMELRRVTLDGAVRIIERNSRVDGREESVQVQRIAMQGLPEHAYRIEAYVREGNVSGEITSSVWSIAENIAAGFSANDLLGAVQVALSTFPTQESVEADEESIAAAVVRESFPEQATVRFHEPTSLLIVRGTKEQLALVAETLQQMRGDAHRKSSDTDEIRELVRTFEQAVNEAEVRARVLRKKLEIATRQHQLQQEAMKEENRSELGAYSVMAPLELAVIEAEGEYQLAADRIARYEARLNELRAQLPQETGATSKPSGR